MTSIATVKPPRELDYLSGKWTITGSNPTVQSIINGSVASFTREAHRGALYIESDFGVGLIDNVIRGFKVGSRYRCSAGGQLHGANAFVRLCWINKWTGIRFGVELRARGKSHVSGVNALPIGDAIFKCENQNDALSIVTISVSGSGVALFNDPLFSFFEIEELP